MKMPEIKINDIVKIGNNYNAPKAQVVYIYNEEDKKHSCFGDLQVIYFQNNKKYIKEDIVWSGEFWSFKNEGPGGVYVDLKNYPNLKI